MTLQELLCFTVATSIQSTRYANWKEYGKLSPSEIYRKTFFFVPFIWCKDGFGISIQVHHGNYCTSENGYQEYGEHWIDAEWGFPTQPIESVKYNAEDRIIYNDNYEEIGEREFSQNTVGRCSVELLQELLDSHGGMDFERMTRESLPKIVNER